MSESLLIEIMQLTVTTITLITAPIILTVMIIGIVAQVLQTITQIKDQALSFVPKVFGAGLVMTLSIPWYIQLIVKYTEEIFSLLSKATL